MNENGGHLIISIAGTCKRFFRGPPRYIHKFLISGILRDQGGSNPHLKMSRQNPQNLSQLRLRRP
jgi:hypothetical protein